ncbi:MAG: hypothetical protein LBT92_00285 [Rickettsiales bacterium]|jgi:hypothetical protein|nr:hypothetical protein [Rickettsiales bacterium]
MDVAAKPGRKYLFAAYYISRACMAMAVISIILMAATIIRSQPGEPRPRLIEWDEAEQRFAGPIIGAMAETPAKSGTEYLEALFVRKYIEKMFTISPSFYENDLAWCATPAKPGTAGIWTSEKCWLAMASSADAYSLFVAEQKTAASNLARTGYTRGAEIKSAEPIRAATITAKRSIFDFILPGGGASDRRSAEYKVDFDLVGSDGKRSGITGYISVVSTAGEINFSVTGTSFMWGRE